MKKWKSGILAVGALAAAAILPVHSASAEVVLKAVTGVSSRSVVSQVFLRWVEQVNENGEGIVKIQYIGGPEITPPFKQAQALKRGLFDILYAPGAFYAGDVKEVGALIASNLPVQKMRENGTFELLDKLWREQLDSHVLGWFDTEVKFHFYFKDNPPKLTDKGPGVDLSGIKMFTTPTFRDFQEALGATPVRMKITEILTGMDRGVITGMGWPEYGMTGLGFQRVIKYRLDPTYYRGNILTLVNAEKWDGLPANVREFLTAEAIRYEKESAKWVRAQVKREQDILKENGMEVVTITGEAAQRYQELAHSIAWDRVAKRSPQYAEQLKKLMYDPDEF
jgi:TRAP-type C4-dicarboxylate transport system substrate-binding protein